ncbi:MAG: hypothetical protein ABIA92_04565 [Patescibacteria group bacterium]
MSTNKAPDKAFDDEWLDDSEDEQRATVFGENPNEPDERYCVDEDADDDMTTGLVNDEVPDEFDIDADRSDRRSRFESVVDLNQFGGGEDGSGVHRLEAEGTVEAMQEA